MPITTTSRCARSVPRLRHTENSASSSLALSSAIQSLACPMSAVRAMATNAAAANDLEENVVRPVLLMKASVSADLEQEVAAALVPGADGLAVLRLLREILLDVARQPLVDIDAVRPLRDVAQRLHEVPGEHRVTVLAGIGDWFFAAR